MRSSPGRRGPGPRSTSSCGRTTFRARARGASRTGSTSCACHHRAPGHSAVRTRSRSPRRSGRPTPPRRTASSTSFGATSAAFGLAPRTDIASWMHLKAGDLAATLERLRLRRFRDEAGKELLDLLLAARSPTPETPVPRSASSRWTRRPLCTRAGRDPPGAVPPGDLLDEDPALDPDLPRGRGGRGAPGGSRAGGSSLRPFEKLDRAVFREPPRGVGAPRRVPRMTQNVGR